MSKHSQIDLGQPAVRRILCIDGGGIKGTQPAAFLATLEEDLDCPIGEYFDLIAGTSTGGILAIGLALGHPAKDLLKLYVDRGPIIFGEPATSEDKPGVVKRLLRRVWAKGKHAVGPKHDATILRDELDKVLQGARIGEARTRLVVPAWDADRRRPYIYKTAHHDRLSTDYREPALDAAMATAAAPTYFRRHKTANNVGLLDGGVWANNPIAIATVEAITCLGWNATDLRVLSLGCTDEIYMLSEEPGCLELGLKFLNLFADGQSHGALGMAKLLTDHSYSGDRIYRYAPPCPAGFFAMDDASKISRLQGMGVSAAREAKPRLKQVFFKSTAEPFVPFHILTGAAA